jgi:uncharacterized protein (DUF1499 family)
MNMQQGAMKQTETVRVTTADAVTVAGFMLAILTGIAAALAGLGSRWGWWHFTVGFTILNVAAIGGMVAAVISLIGGIATRHEHKVKLFILAAAGITIGLFTAGIPWSWKLTAERMPMMNDITTDMTNPPQFIKIMPFREKADAPTAYGGSRVTDQQRAAYPDIQPIILPIAPFKAFTAALKEAKDRGWQIVNSDPSNGFIEAVATTFWFGFKDDVVVRISPAPGGSRIDMRSVSRVGTGDLGANAVRIRSYLKSLVKHSIVDNSYTVGWY